MNRLSDFEKGFFRLWLVLSGLWVLLAFVMSAGGKFPPIETFFILILAPPFFLGVVVFSFLWVWRGFKGDK